MSKYYLDISGDISLSDYSKINDYIAIVGDNDNITITFNDDSMKDTDIVSNILINNKFYVNNKGGNANDNEKYCITATRIKK